MRPSFAFSALLTLLTVLAPGPAQAQVHYFPSGHPWRQRADSGPDAEVDGWLYNLGVTGIRVRLEEENPTHLIVGHVFKGTPADRKVRIGDRIVGAGRKPFATPHQNGYGMEVFGAAGPIADFADALERALNSKKRELPLQLRREGKRVDVKLKLPRRARAFGDDFPMEGDHTEEVREFLLEYLVEQQRENGQWGNPIHDTFAPLALLGSGERKYREAVERNVRFHAGNTHREDDASLVNWKYMSAAIVMSEWYLATKDRKTLRELQEVYDFLCTTQYLDLSR